MLNPAGRSDIDSRRDRAILCLFKPKFDSIQQVILIFNSVHFHLISRPSHSHYPSTPPRPRVVLLFQTWISRGRFCERIFFLKLSFSKDILVELSFPSGIDKHFVCLNIEQRFVKIVADSFGMRIKSHFIQLISLSVNARSARPILHGRAIHCYSSNYS